MGQTLRRAPQLVVERYSQWRRSEKVRTRSRSSARIFGMSDPYGDQGRAQKTPFCDAHHIFCVWHVIHSRQRDLGSRRTTPNEEKLSLLCSGCVNPARRENNGPALVSVY